jgi:hypothetical protein
MSLPFPIRAEQFGYQYRMRPLKGIDKGLTFIHGNRQVWSFPRTHLIRFECRSQKLLAFRFTGGYLVKVIAPDADRLLDSILEGSTAVLFRGFSYAKYPDDGKNPDVLLRTLNLFHRVPKKFDQLVAVASITVDSPCNKRS